MAFLRAATLLGAASAALALGVRAPARAARLESYSFAQFSQEFSRTYEVGSAEYKRRDATFQASLARVHAVNARNARENRPWKSGIHPFMDYSEAERKPLNSGYKPNRARPQGSAGFLSLLNSKATTASRSSARAQLNQTARWAQAHPPIRNQGDCGSCWAISAVESVEAQLLQTGIDVKLSAQALIDCVPNPKHCGGKGGCDGATAELGLQFMRDYGIPLEEDLPYAEKTKRCPITLTGSPWPTARRARVSGFSQLPSNKAEPVMQALNEHGSVAIAVDGGNWFDYSNGVFDGCQKDTVLSHGVLLNGYGEDAGKKYWHIQNSWGAGWGEHGTIRIMRHDSEDEWCGIDNKPQDGIACEGENAPITVCGMCGLLYDPVLPQGARLEEAPVPDPITVYESGSTPAPNAALAAPPSDKASQSLLMSDSSVWGSTQGHDGDANQQLDEVMARMRSD